MLTVYRGTIVHTKSFNEFESLKQGFVAVENGKIIGVGDDYEDWLSTTKIDRTTLSEVLLTEFQFLSPGFCDGHIHAPQYAQIGLGLSVPLLDWLNKYTFPTEAKYVDQEFALGIYKSVVEATLRCGTTLASYFATNNLESTLILAREAARQGQRALIGKVCSNCNSPDFYVETTDESVKGTQSFVKAIRELNNPLVLPTITPRFALSCSKELLRELGNIAKSNDVHVQSHISENLQEIKVVKDIFKTSYAGAYDEAGLLTKKTVMAHGVHLEDDEIALLRERGTSIIHCPASNTNLNSGLCDVQRLINAGISVGLGTDVSGGNSVSILHALNRALDVSKHLDFFNKQDIFGTGPAKTPNRDYQQLSYKQAFYLATLGGAKALSLDHITGNFAVGKEFDALLVDVSILEKPHRTLTVDELVEKFIFTGDDRNITAVFVAGKCVKGSKWETN
ncbi:guanine deaminase [Drosophila grimshawi]|uniref:Guanine deaminase n=1 Tax=Drosophila grimshawi TaxID=7222 RepID=B4JGR1_DROGR|nr:guanine deaminase [Drosophila grimshawi]EDV92665.1 GH18889 [Drosophila grimshawi]